MTLRDLPVGGSATVLSVGGEGALRQHFLDMGIIPKANITLIKYAPMGDPMELRVHSYELTLRLADAENIEIEQIENSQSKKKKDKRKREDKIYCCQPAEVALSDDEVLTYALAGNQNCGKTTLFNQLTGSNQHVGNFPGVTVDRKDGKIKGHSNTLVTDLPGIYSMSPYSSEEIVTRNFVLNEHPKGIINIVDATNIERNMYLTMQLIELGIPMVLALNMMDEVRSNGGMVLVEEMEQILGIPVVPISASKNDGIDELVEKLIYVAKYQAKPGREDFCGSDKAGEAVRSCINKIIEIIKEDAKKSQIPVRFAASKLAEGDCLILDRLALSEIQEKEIEEAICEMERERGLDRAAAIADMRFEFVEKLCDATFVKPKVSKEHIRSANIDKILTGKFTAIPTFILIMTAIFYLTFNIVGAFFQDILATLIEYIKVGVDGLLVSMKVNEALHSLIIDGIFEGVGSVLSFLPIIVTLFFFLSLLEDSGYMARIAFVMDKLLRKIGLSGKSIVPMLIGFGCSVPGIMASRTLPSERDRKMTILLTPFMSCSAKLPIYAFFIAAFFPENGGLVMVGLYFTGIIVGIIIACIFKATVFKGDAQAFVMELPNYRMPGAKNVLHLLWEKARDFIQKAFTVIFIATIVIWFLENFDMHLHMITDSQNSILAVLAGYIAPIFKPLGFGNWQVCVALISGFMAKESVVSTLTVLFGTTAALTNMLTPLAAMSLLVFCLLYTPCAAAIATVKRELGGKMAFIVVIMQCVIAWLVAFIVHTGGLLIGLA